MTRPERAPDRPGCRDGRWLQRFRMEGVKARDGWQDRELAYLSVPAGAENLARVRGAFAFQSSLLQNLVEYIPGNFHIGVLAQTLAGDGAGALSSLSPGAAAALRRRALSLLLAARKWCLDFVDFSRFQVLPGGGLRFAWSLEPRPLPDPAALHRLFGGDRRAPCAPADVAGGDFLCRREDFASHRLLARREQGLGADGGARIRIRTRFPWQEELARDCLYHNLSDAQTLLLDFDLKRGTLGRQLTSCCLPGEDAGDPAALTQKFRLFLRQSVFREAVILLHDLTRGEDEFLVRFLLESGDIPRLTFIFFGAAPPGEYDLEFHEDPPNLLEERPAPAVAHERVTCLDKASRNLLIDIAAIGVPLPYSAARRLYDRTVGTGTENAAAAPGEDAIAALLRQGLLRRTGNGLLAILPGGSPAPLPSERQRLLAWLAGPPPAADSWGDEWPYGRIALLVAARDAAGLQEYLGRLVREAPGRITPGPCAELLGRHLTQDDPPQKTMRLGVEALLQGHCLAEAEAALDAAAEQDRPWVSLGRAHLALRRRNYPELERTLAGLKRPEAELRDWWLYLNFMCHEKLSHAARADHFAGRIRDPYFRCLALLQRSDRSIYCRDFAAARAQLAAVLELFSGGRAVREEFAARSQMAKLLREEGDAPGAEAMYKALYVRGEAEGLPLASAAAAVDLGNLYAESDDDFRAECWYEKADRLFAQEGNEDGAMLVKANLVNVLAAKGDWLQADELLRAVLAWDEERKLLASRAIDLLNQAGLEVLRLRADKALELVGRAEEAFRACGNRKGLGECAFLRLRAGGGELGGRTDGERWLSPDQKAVRDLLARRHAADSARDGGRLRRLDAIASRKLRFEALRLLLNRHRFRPWLERLRQMALELSPQAKNYFYYEYWHQFFELSPDPPAAGQREEFLAMHEFFTRNRRRLSAKLNSWRRECADHEQDARLFADARLVEQHRHWRSPDDFFRSLSRELKRAAPIDWLALEVRERGEALFRFASSDSFPELGGEMLARARDGPPEQGHDQAAARRLYRSPERLFYPFAATKLLRWPIAAHLSACLAVGSRDPGLRHVDLGERCREMLRTFARLFQNYLENEYRVSGRLDFIVGQSPAVRELKRQIAQVAKVDFSLLLCGESGCGKELVARAVHLLGPRAGRPFVSVNAAAIPDTLLEAELFGFRRGAFSGAAENRVGLLEAADRGTLFLDEIADLPMGLQAKLLRALQEKEIRRLGENRSVRVDVRLISASNRDLEEQVRAESFRADLFYRLQDLVIRIPPLRERREDIPLLVEHFLRKHGSPAADEAELASLVDALGHDEFPGNVRELESRVKSLITFRPGIGAVPPPAGATASAAGRRACGLQQARAEFERALLERVLREQRGSRSRSAAALGISRMALFNLLKKHGLAP